MVVSGGYPNSYEKEKEIEGLHDVVDALVFHAGTKQDGAKTISSGGRVLCVTAYGKDFEKALKTSYENVEKISFESAYYRKDIGFDLELPED